MKKITVVLVALFLICAMSTLSFAQTAQATTVKKPEVSAEVVRGKITAIDTVKNEIVVKNNKTGIEKTIAVAPADIASLKVDDLVKITLKAGSNAADKVKKIIKPAAVTAKPVKK